MSTVLTSTTAQLTADLDATGEPWNLWRAATGTWCVSRGEGCQDVGSREVSGATIDEVLVLALASKRLPVIPRRPYLYHYSYEKQSTGTRPYKVLCDGQVIFNLERKHRAIENAARHADSQSRAIEQWRHARSLCRHSYRGLGFLLG